MANLFGLVCALVAGQSRNIAEEFHDDFSVADLSSWTATEGVEWRGADGVLHSPNNGGVPGILFASLTARDVSVRVDVRLPRAGRRNVALAFRFRDDGTGWTVRWYDQQQWLELIRYEKGEVVRVSGNHWQASSAPGSVPQKPDEWYTMAVAAVGDHVRAKVWLRTQEEPDWQFEAECPDTSAGRVGISIDQTMAQFDNFRALTGRHIADLLRDERKRQATDRHRRRSIVLRDTPVGECTRYRADFRLLDGVREPPPELVFRAWDADNYYFCRAQAHELLLGKVIDGTECVLARSPSDWYRGGGTYRVDISVQPARRDDRGPAWFINADHVPPMLQIRARVRRVGEDGSRPRSIGTRDDPIVPGKRGEPYWHTDPFGNSSARNPLGSRMGCRKTPGVTWVAFEANAAPPRLGECPTAEPVQTIHTGDRGGCWVGLGDLDGDGRLDYLVARNLNQAVAALTAYANDGRELWRWGGGGSADIGYDVPATIYDIDLDGAAEALCSVEGFLLVLDGATGVEKRRWPLPEGLKVADCIIIANLRGLSQPADLIVKTRYDRAWAFTNEWEPLWEFTGNTGHHPDVRDVDGDGKDEVLCGFSLIDDDGTVLWQEDLPGHADAARLTEMHPGGAVRALNSCCGGNDLALTTLEGELLWRQRPAITDFHFQTAHVGNVRPDVLGHEIVVDEGWARPGRARLALLDADGRWLGCYYVSYPRFHRLIDWDADGVMEVAIPSDQVLCDGRGRPVLRLGGAPALGGPGVETPMLRIADVCGDGRDELILYNAESIVIYSNPKPSRRGVPPQPVVQQRYYNFTYY